MTSSSPRWCCKCGVREPFEIITSDHIVPRSLLKRLEIPSPSSNRQDLCETCNREKGDGPPVDYRGDRKLYHELVSYLEKHNFHIEVYFVEKRAELEG